MNKISEAFSAMSAKIDTSRYFSEREAWNCFRLAAFGEAIGWTLLISGISIKYFFTPKNNTPVLITGQIHGLLFFIYFVSVLIFFSCLKWKPKQIIIAALASIPPYGTLAFEQWMAHKRRKDALKTYRQIVVRAVIIVNHKLLVVEPRDSGFWCLPGGKVGESESSELALQRILEMQFSKKAKIGELIFTNEYIHRGNPRLELFFGIINSKDFDNIHINKQINFEYEDIKYVSDFRDIDIEPKQIKSLDVKTGLYHKRKPQT